MQKIRFLYQDEHLVIVDKPAGFQVHTPERMIAAGQTLRRNNVMKMVRNQLGQAVFPVHRLDGATSGVLIFALSSEVAALLQAQFKKGEIQKTYLAVIRGWGPDEGLLDAPLDEKNAETRYSSLFRFELPYPSSVHSTSRYSIVEVNPVTGRFHQIRRHFRQISRPLIGDTVYGDGKHNRLWRELTKPGLFLKAYQIRFQHPVTGEPVHCFSKWGSLWLKLFEICGMCPYFSKPLLLK